MSTKDGDLIKLVAVLPVGPQCTLEFIQDTLDSINYYVTSNHKIILIDDTGKDLCSQIKKHNPEIILIQNPRNFGKQAGLYLSLSKAYIWALENLDFDILLRLDTDSLVIGKNPEIDAYEYFLQNPNVGQIGSNKIDCNGNSRDFSWAARQLFYETASFRLFLRYPRKFLLLRRIAFSAMKNGYLPGEHNIGAANFISSICIKRLAKNYLLGRRDLGASRLAEDHIMGLLIRAIGMELGDFATGHKPLGIKWRGLPDSPEKLLERGKKIIHSVRYWEEMKEAEIREFFRNKRGQTGPAGQ
jgi:hypothetical protein